MPQQCPRHTEKLSLAKAKVLPSLLHLGQKALCREEQSVETKKREERRKE